MALLSGMFDKQADILRQKFTPTGAGDFKNDGAPTVIATGVRCLITQRANRELQHVGGRTQLGNYRCHMEYRSSVNLQSGDVITNVAPIANPTDFDMDAAVNFKGEQIEVPRQYKVVSSTDPNGLHDHLEVELDVIEARAMP